jgi:nucleoside-diphosphate-sugar epimerase
MKILVTGCDGYIGCMLVQVLLKQGFDVVGLDTGFYRNSWLYNGVLIFPKVITKDIRKVTKEDLNGIDYIVHLAELSNDPLGQINEDLTYEINHKGTMHLAKIAKECGIKNFIYFSSCSVYGYSNEINNEDSPTNPLTIYAKCKILNEKGLSRLADNQFCPTILRNATAYGASPRMRFDLVINNLCALAYTSKEIKMESDGTPWRGFVHILDIAQAVVCIVNAPREIIFNQIFNVGSEGANYQIKTIAKIINEHFPKSHISLNPTGADERDYRVDFTKINTKLPGFKCKWDIEKGVKQLKKILETISIDMDVTTSRSFIRLKQIQYLLSTKQIDENLYWLNI